MKSIDESWSANFEEHLTITYREKYKIRAMLNEAAAPAKVEPLAVAYWVTMFHPLKANPKPAPLTIAITVYFVTTSISSPM
jgi:hypothetical protein